MPRRGDSNEYPQHMFFYGELKKIIFQPSLSGLLTDHFVGFAVHQLKS